MSKLGVESLNHKINDALNKKTVFELTIDLNEEELKGMIVTIINVVFHEIAKKLPYNNVPDPKIEVRNLQFIKTHALDPHDKLNLEQTEIECLKLLCVVSVVNPVIATLTINYILTNDKEKKVLKLHTVVGKDQISISCDASFWVKAIISGLNLKEIAVTVINNLSKELINHFPYENIDEQTKLPRRSIKDIEISIINQSVSAKVILMYNS